LRAFGSLSTGPPVVCSENEERRDGAPVVRQ
jgi:hypothetical protein